MPSDDYLEYLHKKKAEIEAAMDRELKRMGLESDLCIILMRLNKMTGMSFIDAFLKAYEDAKKLADV